MKKLCFKSFFTLITCHPFAWIGAILTTSSAIFTIVYLIFSLTHHNTSNYLDILFIAVIAPMFFGGLFLIPAGIFFRTRRWLRQHPEKQDDSWMTIVRDVSTQHSMLKATPIIIFLTLINIVIAIASVIYSYEYVESPKFCGTTCHAIMMPEYHRYQASPHANVSCVECHVGEGITWFVKAKINGMRQLYGMMTNNYQRPIPAPVEHMRPARATCEHCHRPEHFTGEKLKVYERFDTDRDNTRKFTILLMKIGHASAVPGATESVHWHVDPGNTVEFISDKNQRRYIPWVKFQKAGQGPVEFKYTGTELPSAEVEQSEKRTMDCLDCHNRPTHIYMMPDDAMDEVLRKNPALRQIPYFKKAALEVLHRDFSTQEINEQAIRKGMIAWYKQSPSSDFGSVDAQLLKEGADAVQTVYAENIFPEMKITWGTYPNHISHIHSPGCLRCHENSHRTSEGKPINSGCRSCHTILALKETDPAILKVLKK